MVTIRDLRDNLVMKFYKRLLNRYFALHTKQSNIGTVILSILSIMFYIYIILSQGNKHGTLIM